MRGGSEHMRMCRSCGGGLERGQRYCVLCGERAAPRSPPLLSMLHRGARARARGSTPDAGGSPTGRATALAAGGVSDAGPSSPSAASTARSAASTARARPAAWLERTLGDLVPPAPWISALLILGFLGFGILAGDIAASRPSYALSAARRPVKLILPSAPPAGAAAQGGTTGGEPEPPPANSQATPERSESSAPEASSSTGSPKSSTSSSTASKGEESEAASGNSGSRSGSVETNAPSRSKLPPVKHVFVIMLSGEPFANAFGPSSTAPYASQTLEHRGELLARYYGVAPGALANGVALLSGQGPNVATAAECPAFADISPAGAGAKEQVTGEGCVYPAATNTLMAQLARKHLEARAYVQGIDEAGSTAPACAHPPLGAPDPTAQPTSSSPYATAHNPFMYFHAVIDTQACSGEDVGLAALAHDLATEARTPAFSYIVPDRCDDGSPSPCAAGAPAGMPPADALLKRVVPEILASPAFRKNGLLLITVDAAPSSGELADSSSCCGQPRFPNLPPPTGKAALLGPEGGGQVGAILLSRYVKAGSVSQEPYNHFSLLRTIEDFFGLPHLGYAALAKVSPFEPSIFPAR